MKKPLNPQLRIKIRMRAAFCGPSLSIGGGEKKHKPRPISLAAIPEKREEKKDDRV